jgi:hypothetical protein
MIHFPLPLWERVRVRGRQFIFTVLYCFKLTEFLGVKKFSK